MTNKTWKWQSRDGMVRNNNLWSVPHFHRCPKCKQIHDCRNAGSGGCTIPSGRAVKCRPCAFSVCWQKQQSAMEAAALKALMV